MKRPQLNINGWFAVSIVLALVLLIGVLWCIEDAQAQTARYSVVDGLAGYATNELPYSIVGDVCYASGAWCEDWRHNPRQVQLDYTVVDWHDQTVTLVYWTRWYCFALRYAHDFGYGADSNPHPTGAWYVTC